MSLWIPSPPFFPSTRRKGRSLDALLPVLEKLGVVCGVSSPFTNLYDANHAWFQASAALQNGLSQGGTIFRFQDYLLPQLLSGALAGQADLGVLHGGAETAEGA